MAGTRKLGAVGHVNGLEGGAAMEAAEEVVCAREPESGSEVPGTGGAGINGTGELAASAGWRTARG